MTTADIDPEGGGRISDDERFMARALESAARVRTITSPNPWVGAVIVTPHGECFDGATTAVGGPHAEVVALSRAGQQAAGATLYVTLEPCAHQGRTPPCTKAIIDAGISRVVICVGDPDSRVSGRGIEELLRAGIEVTTGVCEAQGAELLAPYLHHRRTGMPYVVLKLAASLDGRTAAPDATSKWITGEAARLDAHRLRAESDAVIVGAGTVRADDPALTVRIPGYAGRQPLRVVLGSAPKGAAVHPCEERAGDIAAILADLGARGCIQVLIEGGATVAHEVHMASLVDRYVVYLAPALFGGSDGRGLFAGPGAPTIAALWRGRIVSFAQIGDDLRVEVVP